MFNSKRNNRIDYSVGALALGCVILGLTVAWVALRNADSLIPHILPEILGKGLSTDSTSSNANVIAQTVSTVLSLVLGVPVALLGSLVAIYLASKANSISNVVKDIEQSRLNRDLRTEDLAFLEEAHRDISELHLPVSDAYIKLIDAGRAVCWRYVNDINSIYQLNDDTDISGYFFLILDPKGKTFRAHISAEFRSLVDDFAQARTALERAVAQRTYNSSNFSGGNSLSYQNDRKVGGIEKIQQIAGLEHIPEGEMLCSSNTWAAVVSARTARPFVNDFASTLFYYLDATFRQMIGDVETFIVNEDSVSYAVEADYFRPHWSSEKAMLLASNKLNEELFSLIGLFYFPRKVGTDVNFLDQSKDHSEALLRIAKQLEADAAYDLAPPDDDDHLLDPHNENAYDEPADKRYTLFEYQATYIEAFKTETEILNVGAFILNDIFCSLPSKEDIQHNLEEALKTKYLELDGVLDAERWEYARQRLIPSFLAGKRSLRVMVSSGGKPAPVELRRTFKPNDVLNIDCEYAAVIVKRIRSILRDVRGAAPANKVA